MKWTKKQQQAIEKRNSNLLVSAAAGSGKTAVLVERITRLIIEDRVPIDEILVVTFTKAAASEMKEKIIKAIYDAMKSKEEKIPLLQDQLEKAHKGHISTFHSFAMDLIRDYFFIIDLDPGVKICDETQSKILQNQSIQRVFQRYYQEKNEDFLQLISRYSTIKDDGPFMEQILGLYHSVRSIPNSFSWFREKIEQLNLNKEEYKKTSVFRWVQGEIQREVQRSILDFSRAQQLLDRAEVPSYGAKNKKDLNYLCEMAKGKEISEEDILAFKPERMVGKKEEKASFSVIESEVAALRNKGKERIKKIKDHYCIDSMEDRISLVKETYPVAKIIGELLERFHEEYGQRKKEKKVIDFSDIEHFSIEILKNPLVADEVRSKFQYIFIDEYQDSNFLQEEILSRIKRKDNLFMVGDIKQSIYGFRLAEPEIFQEKYEKYSWDGKTSCKIDLNENFRSKDKIIKVINNLFENIMEDYGEEHRLYPGLSHEVEYSFYPQLHVVDFPGEDIEQEEMDEEFKDKESAYWEAKAAVEIIKENLGKTIWDVKNNRKRSMTYGDMVILIRGLKGWGAEFQEVFSQSGIPLYLDDHGGYFDTIEMILFTDLLRVINNRRQDVPLLGVLRSSVFSFSLEQLVEIRTHHKEDGFYQAFLAYKENGPIPSLREKITNFFGQIDHWKKMARYLPLDEFVWKVMEESDFYYYVGALPGGNQRQANLRLFIEKTRQYMENGDHTIFGLIHYIETMGKQKIETGQAELIGEEENIVRMMTIHQSKGLEFPLVIVAGLGKRFVTSSGNALGLTDRELGYGIPYIEEKKQWKKSTLWHRAIADKKKKQEWQEEIRILYVAMTRAMDQLILLATADWERKKEKYLYGSQTDGCYLDLIGPFLGNASMNPQIHPVKELSSESASRRKENQDPVGHKEEQREIKEIIQKKLQFMYPYEKETKAQSKFTVSQLLQENQEAFGSQSTGSLRRDSFSGNTSQLTGAEKGILLHRVMEHLCFKTMIQMMEGGKEEHYLNKVMEELEGKNLLSQEEKKQVQLSQIRPFFEDTLGQRMAKAKEIKKEEPFTMMMEKDGVPTMVQGVIDCYFQEDDGLVLVDYKSNADTRGLKEKYKKQIELYRQALEEGLELPVKEAYLYAFSTGEWIKVDG